VPSSKAPTAQVFIFCQWFTCDCDFVFWLLFS
jgi:hypothetical protein